MAQSRKAFIGIAVFAICVASLIYSNYRKYPFGVRTCFLPCMLGALRSYAVEHDGWFPKDGKTPLESLQIVYNSNPEYFGTGDLLAGISGDRGEVKKRLQMKQPIDETVSSWVYFPGFCNADDSRIAIIWERQQGITFNGHSSDGHVVGFVDGHSEQVPQYRWPGFVKEQEALRSSALAKRRASQTMNELAKPNP